MRLCSYRLLAFGEFMARQGVGDLAALPAWIDPFVAQIRCRDDHRGKLRLALLRFIRFLHQKQVIPAPEPLPTLAPHADLVEDYLRRLQEQRGAPLALAEVGHQQAGEGHQPRPRLPRGHGAGRPGRDGSRSRGSGRRRSVSGGRRIADAARRPPGRGPQWLDRVRRFRESVDALLPHYRGREIGRPPDGAAAIFDGPVRALRCAAALRDAARELGIALHGGVHTGEVDITQDEVGGSAVHLAARIAAVARADEILVSTTVRDIVPGSGLHFADAGVRFPPEQVDAPRLLILGSEGENASTIAVAAKREPDIALLSPRERQILVLVARGCTNGDIATELALSEHTVKRHVANILMKLDFANRSTATAFAVRHRLL